MESSSSSYTSHRKNLPYFDCNEGDSLPFIQSIFLFAIEVIFSQQY